MWLDDALVLEHFNVKTQPRDRLMSVHGTDGIYDRMQVGITANTTHTNLEMFVDDVELYKL